MLLQSGEAGLNIVQAHLEPREQAGDAASDIGRL